MDKSIAAELVEQKRRLLADIQELESQDPVQDDFRDINNTDEDDVAEAEDHTRIQARVDAAKTQLDQVTQALAKIDDGTYGKCQRCGQDIPAARLKAKPFAIYDIACEEIIESGRS